MEKTSSEECTICRELLENSFTKNIERIRITPCMHQFHENCLKKWLLR